MTEEKVLYTAVLTATNATDVETTMDIPPQYLDGTWSITGFGAFYTATDLDATFVNLWLERQSGNTFPDQFGFPLGEFTLRSHQPGAGTTPPSFGARYRETHVPLPTIESRELMRLKLTAFNQNNQSPGIRGFLILRREDAR